MSVHLNSAWQRVCKRIYLLIHFLELISHLLSVPQILMINVLPRVSRFLTCDCEMNQWTDWPRRPTPFVAQSSPRRLPWRDVRTTMCCMSRHVRYGLEIQEEAEGKMSSSCEAKWRNNLSISPYQSFPSRAMSSNARLSVSACHTILPSSP